jgi:glutathione S-transferase
MRNDHPASQAGRTTARITLYGPPYAPYTEKVRRALILKGIDFDFREPSAPEDYKRWSPDTGLLPVLAVGEERIQDSTAILLRLDELFPDPPLLSSTPRVAAQQRQLEDWADESFLWYYLKWQRMKSESETPQGESTTRSSAGSAR